MMNRVFITGMGRSGTTLLEKLLTNHKQIEILSQPFPLLFVEIKKDFLLQLGIEKYYVLNDNAVCGDYDLETFNRFLATYKFSYQALKQLFIKMKCYSGQMTKINFNLNTNECYSFLEAFDILSQDNLVKKDTLYFGSKEIICEEFIPYFTKNSTKVVLIIRDPRDVVASVNYPKKEKYLGDKKPTLFILRGWRRTIEYINMMENKEILYIKYEDLVTDPYNTLNKITFFLDLEPFAKNHFDAGIYDRDGNLWQANTSFDTKTSFISSQSVGGYKKILSSDEINYIESICKYEMDLMGYTLDTIPNKKIIKNFRDYFIESSEHLDKNYSSLDENVEKELARYGKYNN